MNIFTSMANWLRGGSISNSEIGEQSPGPTKTMTHSGISLTDQGALGISAVWACTQYITNAIASLPVEWYERVDDGRKPLDMNHPLSRLFLNRPNQFMKTRDFRKAMTFQMAFFNNAYAKIDWRDDVPIAITPLDPVRMTPYRDETGLTYHYSMATGTHVFADKSILHMKGMTSDGVVGLDRIGYSRETLGISASADRYASKQFANGGRSGGVLTIDSILTPDQREQLRVIYEGISAGADNANKLWVLEGGTQYNLTDFDPDKMQMIGTREFQISEAARFWGVPEALISGGSKGTSWPASFEQQVLSFLTFTLQSYMDEWEAALVDALVPVQDRRTIFFDHDVDGFIRMDSAAKATYLSSLTQNGLMSRNEGRRKLNLPKHEGADELTVQVNLTPLQDLPKVTDQGQNNAT
jgi:HK97 family phage portal protein